MLAREGIANQLTTLLLIVDAVAMILNHGNEGILIIGILSVKVWPNNSNGYAVCIYRNLKHNPFYNIRFYYSRATDKLILNVRSPLKCEKPYVY